jgi:hypothetical protein
VTTLNDATHVKDPGADLPFAWDWSAWLSDGETITAQTITADAGITVSAPTEDLGVVTVRISGGTAGTTYKVACRITTSGGNIDERTKRIMVRDR